MNIIVKKAEKSEWRSLLDLYTREGLTDLYPSVTDNIANEFSEIGTRRVIWLAKKDDIVVGTVTLILDHPQKDLADGKVVAMVKRLRIAKEFEGTGIASLLNRELEEEAKQRGYRKLSIEVSVDNERAKGIYDHWGYTFLRYGLRNGEMALVKDLQ